MATPTYTPIESYTVSGTSTSTVTLGSGGTIPQTYTDLVVVANYGISANFYGLRIRFNSDTGANYSDTTVYGDGSSATSSRDSSATSIVTSAIGVSDSVLNYNFICNVQNYANTNTYKTAIVRANAANRETVACVGSWRSNSAITSINIFVGSGYILPGTTFTLYGIANAAIGAPKATGGIITYDDTYFYHTFGASGTFTPQQSLTADILVVAGGGGGANNQYGNSVGGGGGAGGLLGFASQSLSATGYTVTVGAGGSAGTTGAASGTGGDSQFGALTLVKGGGRGAGWAGGFYGATNGGSGGGGSGWGASQAGIGGGGSATSGQGYAGGSSVYDYPTYSTYSSAGGGGAGAVGQSASSATVSGNGGVGLSTYSSWGLVTGTGQNVSGTVYYAGGGGSGGYSGVSFGTGGLGGGGTGANVGTSVAASGLANTGGGGGGGGNNTPGAAGAGGSGVVIIRYLKA